MRFQQLRNIAITTIGGVSISAGMISGGSAVAQFRGGDYRPVLNNNQSAYRPSPITSNADRQNTEFQCDDRSPNWILWVSRGNYSAKLIEFTPAGSRSFSQQYTPEVRCEAVKENLTDATNYRSYEPGSLEGVRMSWDTLGGQNVICAIGPNESHCNGNNTILTLKNGQEDPNVVLTRLFKNARGITGGVIRETTGKVAIDLGEWEANTLGDSAQSISTPVSEPNHGTSPYPNPVQSDGDQGSF